MDLGQAWRGIVAGIKSGFWAGQPIPIYKMQSATMVEAVGTEVSYLSTTVEERGRACAEAKDLMVACEETVIIFINTQRAGRSNIGSCVARNDEECCTTFLKEYYSWLSGKYIEEAKKIKKIPIIPVPDMPDMPGGIIPWYVKYMIPIFIVLIVIVIMLVALGYSGLGPAVGRRM